MLNREGDLELVGVAENGAEAVRLAPQVEPDLILMDLRMPVMNGVEAIQKIRKVCPETKFIILTVYEDDEQIFEGIRAGAKAFLLKDISREELVDVMRSVHGGKAHIQPELTSRLLERIINLENNSQSAGKLTERELAVLELLAKGASNKEIGTELTISSHTVKSHVANIFAKLEVTDRTEAVARALQRGIIKLPR